MAADARPTAEAVLWRQLIEQLVKTTPDVHAEYAPLQAMQHELMYDHRCGEALNGVCTRATAKAVEQRAVRLENLASMQNKLINCDNNYVKLDDDIVMEVQRASLLCCYNALE